LILYLFALGLLYSNNSTHRQQFRSDVAGLRAPSCTVLNQSYVFRTVQSFANLSERSLKNVLINSGFQINQRVYASGGTLATGTYGHDRWKTGTGGTGAYTFTQSSTSTQVTIASGRTLLQVVENLNVEGGSYTLSWKGTAQARIGVNTDTPSGSYASSPITITGQTKGTTMSVEFNAGTLLEPVLNVGTSIIPFVASKFDDELRNCQRYYVEYGGDTLYQKAGVGSASTTTPAYITVTLPVIPRVKPSAGISVSNVSDWTVAFSSTAVTTAIAYDDCSHNLLTLNCTVASGLTANTAVRLQANATLNARLRISCEL
jgi:hypothetical protein